MNLVDAIEKANLGQKVKRRNPSTVGFVKNEGTTVVKVTKADYEATDWVLVVPKKKVTYNVGDTFKVGSTKYRVISTMTI